VIYIYTHIHLCPILYAYSTQNISYYINARHHNIIFIMRLYYIIIIRSRRTIIEYSTYFFSERTSPRYIPRYNNTCTITPPQNCMIYFMDRWHERPTRRHSLITPSLSLSLFVSRSTPFNIVAHSFAAVHA